MDLPDPLPDWLDELIETTVGWVREVDELRAQRGQTPIRIFD